MRSKGLRFFSTDKEDVMGNKLYEVKLPSYVTTNDCRTLISYRIEHWTDELVREMNLNWNDRHHGIALNAKEKTLTYYFPQSMTEEKISVFIEKLNQMFLDEWK